MSTLVPILKDKEREHPVPSVWRRTLQEIAVALMNGNFNLYGLIDVEPLDDAEAARVSGNIKAYGCTLISLPSACWDTSVCMWQLDYWEVLVDLFTVEEGRSDLALNVRVYQRPTDFTFKVQLVYVP